MHDVSNDVSNDVNMEEIVDQELGSDSDRLVETVSSYVQV
jgi:hypothetical protein